MSKIKDVTVTRIAAGEELTFKKNDRFFRRLWEFTRSAYNHERLSLHQRFTFPSNK